MKYILALFALSIVSINSNAALIQLQFSGTLTQTESSISDTWGLEGASYIATFVIDDSASSTQITGIQSVTNFNFLSSTLELFDSDFDGIYHGTGSSSCCGGTLRTTTWDNNEVPWGDEVAAYQSLELAGSTFDWGGSLDYEYGLFTYGSQNSPTLIQSTDATRSHSRIEPDNRESYWDCDAGGCNVNPDYREASFIDYSTVATISTVPIPASVWLFASGLLSLMGMSRRKNT